METPRSLSEKVQPNRELGACVYGRQASVCLPRDHDTPVGPIPSSGMHLAFGLRAKR